jgi:hypothetical protein
MFFSFYHAAAAITPEPYLILISALLSAAHRAIDIADNIRYATHISIRHWRHYLSFFTNIDIAMMVFIAVRDIALAEAPY